MLQQLVVDLEIGSWAARGFELDAPDPEDQQARRARVETAFWVLDELGWSIADDRGLFHVTLRDRTALGGALDVWCAWQEQAVRDARTEGSGLTAAADAAAAVDVLAVLRRVRARLAA